MLAITRSCRLYVSEPYSSMKRVTAWTSAAELTLGRRRPSRPGAESCGVKSESGQVMRGASGVEGVRRRLTIASRSSRPAWPGLIRTNLREGESVLAEA